MTQVPNADRAVLDIRKIADYCLSPSHPRGRHKARVFRDALGLNQSDAGWLQGALLDGLRQGEAFELPGDDLGGRWRVDVPVTATWQKRCGKNRLDCAKRRANTPFRNLLGALMMNERSSRLSELDVVALLSDLPVAGLLRGQVGTVVEILGKDTALVEFSDDDGRAYAIVSCPVADLLILHYIPEAAA